jgi:hypothetical protein
MKRRLVGVLIAGSFLGSACSTYTSVAPALTPKSGTVRLSMNDAGRTGTLPRLGGQVTSVEGEVRSINDSSVTIAVTEVSRASSDAESYHGEAVTIPSRYIGTMERKRVQIGRTLLVAGAFVAGAIWVAAQGHGNATLGPAPGPPIGGQ